MTWRVIWPAALLAVNACASLHGTGPAFQTRSWRTYLGSPERAAAAPAALAPDPRPVWRVQEGHGVVGAPALTERLVVLARADRDVTVLDRATGATVWRRGTGEYVGAGPLVDYDRVYVATVTGQGHVAALDLANGRQLWRVVVGPVAAPLLAHDTRLYAATLHGAVTAFSTTHGDRLWRTDLHGAVRAALLRVGGNLVAATTADSLYLLAGDGGAVLARRGTEGSVIAAPALADSVVVFGTTAGRLVGCDVMTLATLWSLDVGGGVVGAVVVQRDTALALTDAGDLWRVPLAAPDRATRLALGIVSRAAPTPTAAGVLVTDITGRVALVRRDGSIAWSAPVRPPVAQPALVDGDFFVVVSQRGEVVAFR